MRLMRGVFHELDRRLIAKRLRDGRNAKAANGGHATGSPPYGWRVDKPNPANPHGALVPDAAEQVALARMSELQGVGYSTREIARVLAAEGHPTKRGGRWTSPVVARIMGRANTTEPTVRQQES
jgi:DNA invertase Pin-like site-specific DNA recombinase